jgi:hypothetical protein
VKVVVLVFLGAIAAGIKFRMILHMSLYALMYSVKLCIYVSHSDGL